MNMLAVSLENAAVLHSGHGF